MALEITDKNFEKLMSNNSKPIVLDFYAQWCAPCKGVSASINNMADAYENQVEIGMVDVDTNPAITSKFGVRNMPTVLYLKNGKVVDKQVGATSQLVLEEKLKAIL